MLTLYKNDIGTDILLDIGTSLDDATAIEIHVVKPSGSHVVWGASASETPDAIIHTTVSGDLDEAGLYEVHAYVEWGGGDAFTGADTILEVTDGTASTEAYLSLYWSGLKAQLDAIDTGLYSDMILSAVKTLDLFDTSFLTAAQLKQACALLICIDCGEMGSLAGNSQEKYFSKLKIYDRTMEGEIGLDSFTGSFCRLLKITLKEFNSKTLNTRSSIYKKIRSDSIYMAPNLDQRGKIFRDYDISEVRNYRRSHTLDNRYSL
jgi:hypothetical protein